eukprot:TRINITY_DN404_c0_g1_i1.p1 TRINITY_DN404_c0_g1~~TRINITY_DN404_c0_g1_i1.p1  ORF type:complete len:328 (-),score=90.91 TRINITY_DN404_c0_g1_i1:370-1353(-)
MMKTCSALALLVAPVAADVPWHHATGKTQVNDPKHIEHLNSQAGSGWMAGVNKFFDGMTFDEARVLLGTAPSHISEHLNKTLDDSVYAVIADEDVPSDFDARTKWPGLIHPIRDQQRCGSCWAFSSSEVLSDRVSIASGKKSPVLSPEDMVSCDKKDMGCGGGQLPNAWEYLTNTGIVTDSCMPYTAGGGSAPTCPTKCADSESFTRTKAQKAYAINGVANMQKDIMTNGPVQAAFLVYKSFMSYKGGVYSKHFWEIIPEGGHAIKILGWGTDAGKDYWLVANSWTTNWGEEGFFRIARGKNACGIEKMGPPYAGTASAMVDDLIVL